MKAIDFAKLSQSKIGFEVMKYDNDFLIEKKYPHRIWDIKYQQFSNEYQQADGQIII